MCIDIHHIFIFCLSVTFPTSLSYNWWAIWTPLYTN